MSQGKTILAEQQNHCLIKQGMKQEVGREKIKKKTITVQTGYDLDVYKNTDK